MGRIARTGLGRLARTQMVSGERVKETKSISKKGLLL